MKFEVIKAADVPSDPGKIKNSKWSAVRDALSSAEFGDAVRIMDTEIDVYPTSFRSIVLTLCKRNGLRVSISHRDGAFYIIKLPPSEARKEKP